MCKENYRYNQRIQIMTKSKVQQKLTSNNNLVNLTFTPKETSDKFNYYFTPIPKADIFPFNCFPQLFNTARNHIAKNICLGTQDILWITTTYEDNSFTDIIFGLKNSVFAVKLIYYINGQLMKDDLADSYDYVSKSIEYNYVPCVLPVYCTKTDSSISLSLSKHLIDARTGKKINPLKIASDTPTLMSEHELVNIAVKTIRDAMDNRGERLELYSIFPPYNGWNICFIDKKGVFSSVIVDYTHDINDLINLDISRFLKDKKISDSYSTYLAPVFIGSNNEKIYRNDTLQVSYLEDILIKVSDIS